MRLTEKYFRFGQASKAFLSLVMVLLMLALSALATSSALHRALHSDSDNPNHQCLLTAFASGQLSGAEMTSVMVFVAALMVCAVLLPPSSPRTLFEYRFAPSRAPPRS